VLPISGAHRRVRGHVPRAAATRARAAVYFGLPNVGISLPSFTVLWLVLALVLAAFAEEIFWAAFSRYPKDNGRRRASTGLGFLATLTYVVLPAAGAPLTVPPITNRTVAITKNTALGTVIGVGEILNQRHRPTSFAGKRHAADDGRDRLRAPIYSGGRARALPRDTLCLAESLIGLAGPQILQPSRSWNARCRSCSWASSRRFSSVSWSSRSGSPAVLLSRCCRWRAPRPVRWAAIVGIDFFRAVPPLVLLIFVYSGLPVRRLPALAPSTRGRHRLFFPPTPRAITARSIAPASRASAAGPMGLPRARPAFKSWQTLAYIVLPQAVRNVLPRSRVEHRRGGEAHLDRQSLWRCRSSCIRRHGALSDDQQLRDRTGGRDLSVMLWPVVRAVIAPLERALPRCIITTRRQPETSGSFAQVESLEATSTVRVRNRMRRARP